MTTRASFNQNLKRIRLKALRLLKIEQVWAELRWSLLIILLWGLASLFHLPQKLPDIFHGLAELAVLLLCFYLFFTRRKKSIPPTTEELDRLIERSTPLYGRPLACLNDSPASPPKTLTSQAHLQVWQEYQNRLISSLSSLKVRKPRFFHHWYERITLLVLIVLYSAGLFLAGQHSLSRLEAGFIPGIDDDLVPLASVQAWIEPPAFTKKTILFLQNQTHTLETPILQGSHFYAVITGGKKVPHISGIEKLKAHKLEDKNWKIEGLVFEGKTIKIFVRGRIIAFWNIHVEKDIPPFINWKEKPKSLKDSWRTSISWIARQPQGLKSIELVLTQRDQHPLHGYQPRISHIVLPLENHPTSNEGQVNLDLSADPFAGGKVEAYLEATSLSGLTARSSIKQIDLTPRPFLDPLARALIDLRKRVSLHEETYAQSFDELLLLSQLPMSYDVRSAFSQALISAKKARPSDQLREILWFLALYEEDRSNAGTAIALSMAEFRAAHQDVLHNINQIAGQTSFSISDQEILHAHLERLQTALDKRMDLMFNQANQTGIILPIPSDKDTPWQKLTHKIQQEVLQNQTSKALNHLAKLSDMAEQMRQAQKPDLQSLALQMKAQQEARDQRSALQALIKKETELLNHTHRRQATSSDDQDSQSQDVTQMSTASLLRQLGITPPENLDHPHHQTVPGLVMEQQFSTQRQEDYQIQQALQTLTKILIERGKELTHKDNKAFERASKDMVQVLKFIAQRNDPHTALAEQKVLEDLSQAQKEMKKNQHSMQNKSQGRLGFILPPHASQTHQSPQKNGSASEPQDEDEDDGDEDGQSTASKKKDPLGRSLDPGNNPDAHIPDNYKNRSIERELRRRASDRTRPKAELDYLERLLEPFSHPNL